MKAHVASVQRLMEELGNLPGFGRKSAERVAYHILKGDPAAARRLAEAVLALHERVRKCSVCGAFAEAETCEICSDPRRDREVICVVEMPQDVAQIEKTGDYRGLYHVLMGRLSPIEGVGPSDIRVKELVRRIEAGGVREVVVATNPTAEGDATAAHVERQVASLAGRRVPREKMPRVTRPARGIPAGSSIEFVDAGILGEAMRRRSASREGSPAEQQDGGR